MILRNSPEQSVRTFSAVLLRRNLTSMNSELAPVWLALTPETKENAKNTLLQTSVSETSKTVKDKICDCIGELAGNLMTKKINDAVEGWANID